MEDREMPRVRKYGESKNDSNYDGNCTARHFLFWTQKISGRWILVRQNVQYHHHHHHHHHHQPLQQRPKNGFVLILWAYCIHFISAGFYI